MMAHIDLNGSWRLLRAGESEAIPARVPGCVHKDLMAAGRIPDPQVRDNEKLVQWVGETEWAYGRDFIVDAALLDYESIELVCDGLDTLTTIRINGHRIAITANMHCRYRFPIAEHLRAGENRIEIVFSPPLSAVRELQERRAMPHWPGEFNTPGFSWLRKAHYNFGWDWGQKLATCGIWRGIRIEAWNSATLGDIRVNQAHVDGRVEVTISPEVRLIREDAVAWRATLMLDGETIAQGVTSQNSLTLSVEKPVLWWPAGMGEQPLYDLRIELGNDVKTIRVGLRTLRLRREPDEWGESFAFEANGKRFFAKGASWIPTDSYATCSDPDVYRSLLQSAVDANMNMLRVWGGGIYEEERFYDLCDELGLCVWQDFMFACAGYPLDEPEFIDNIRAEAVDNVGRLQHHACLAFWCGNNELELGWKSGWGLVGDEWQYGAHGHMPFDLYSEVFDRLLPTVIRDEDGEHDYWPGSPHSPLGDRKDSNNPACGDAHVWDVLMACEPFEFYRTCDHRFMSEFGFQSLPAPRILERVIAKEDCNFTSRIMDWHQRMPVGNGGILHQLARHLPLPSSFEMTVWATQILHAVLLETAIGHWRRNIPRTMGVLNWMLNDQWPAMTNSTLDCDGGWKAPHYALRRLFAPLVVSGVSDAKRGAVDVHVSSDRQEPCAVEVSWTVMRTDGQVQTNGTVQCDIPSLADRAVTRLDLREFIAGECEENLLIWLDLRHEGEFVSEALVTLVPPKHLNLLDPALTVEAEGGTFIISAKRPALWVWGDVPGASRLSDNFFHFRPGQVKIVRAEAITDLGTWHTLVDLVTEQ